MKSSKLLAVVFSTLFFFSVALPIFAQDFVNDYKVEYFLNADQDVINTRVKFTITLTNIRSDVYVNKFSIGFPKTFVIKNITASDDKGRINPKITSDDAKTNVQMEFNDPLVGKGTVNHFFLEFEQENLFKVNGNVWEVILPTIEDGTRNNYNVLVHLPENSQRKISIAKPKPDQITGSTIMWNNPKNRTIYAVFGERQYYKTKLNYHLQNSKITPVYTDIALPPDTLYQKVYVESIEPAPKQTYLDEDGNFMARYILKPTEKTEVVFQGVIEVFAQPREDFQPFIADQFKKQKSYLLTQKSYWKLDNPSILGGVKTPEDIYYFITKKFNYNYKRINKNIKRLGASQALLNPDQAVCVEFTDTFTAAARENGIYSREIQGYGFSNDPQLRPLSLISDILHSWPEYYDIRSNLWIPLDPTWENTSGIDYFTSFDLNHIAFAIHGKEPEYPYPAGSYKTEDTRDITIFATAEKPNDKTDVRLRSFTIPSQITDTELYTIKLTIKNEGNIYALNVPIELSSDNLEFSQNSFIVSALAPLEERELMLQYRSRVKNKKDAAELLVSMLGANVYTGKISIVPYYYEVGLKIGYVVLGGSAIILILVLLRKLRHRDKLS